MEERSVVRWLAKDVSPARFEVAEGRRRLDETQLTGIGRDDGRMHVGDAIETEMPHLLGEHLKCVPVARALADYLGCAPSERFYVIQRKGNELASLARDEVKIVHLLIEQVERRHCGPTTGIFASAFGSEPESNAAAGPLVFRRISVRVERHEPRIYICDERVGRKVFETLDSKGTEVDLDQTDPEERSAIDAAQSLEYGTLPGLQIVRRTTFRHDRQYLAAGVRRAPIRRDAEAVPPDFC